MCFFDNSSLLEVNVYMHDYKFLVFRNTNKIKLTENKINPNKSIEQDPKSLHENKFNIK
jgi:hypothetical protein